MVLYTSQFAGKDGGFFHSFVNVYLMVTIIYILIYTMKCSWKFHDYPMKSPWILLHFHEITMKIPWNPMKTPCNFPWNFHSARTARRWARSPAQTRSAWPARSNSTSAGKPYELHWREASYPWNYGFGILTDFGDCHGFWDSQFLDDFSTDCYFHGIGKNKMFGFTFQSD